MSPTWSYIALKKSRKVGELAILAKRLTQFVHIVFHFYKSTKKKKDDTRLTCEVNN
jgi:hypothetical protein